VEHKNLEGFDLAKCIASDKAFVVQFDNYPLGSNVIKGMLLPIG
jgi:hypothetical protein